MVAAADALLAAHAGVGLARSRARVGVGPAHCHLHARQLVKALDNDNDMFAQRIAVSDYGRQATQLLPWRYSGLGCMWSRARWESLAT